MEEASRDTSCAVLCLWWNKDKYFHTSNYGLTVVCSSSNLCDLLLFSLFPLCPFLSSPSPLTLILFCLFQFLFDSPAFIFFSLLPSLFFSLYIVIPSFHLLISVTCSCSLYFSLSLSLLSHLLSPFFYFDYFNFSLTRLPLFFSPSLFLPLSIYISSHSSLPLSPPPLFHLTSLFISVSPNRVFAS